MNDTASETVQQIPISELFPFRDHPYRVIDDDAMNQTSESIKEFGVMVPLIVRPRDEGGYEIISGHRRRRAAELAGVEAVPVLVRSLDDDQAAILVVDSNLHREDILPSERAKAYKLKMDALRHQGRTSSQLGTKLRTLDVVGEENGDSRNQVHRYVRLTSLEQPLLDMVDSGELAFTPAVEISFLKPAEQHDLLDAMEYAQSVPSLSQAQKFKEASRDGSLSSDVMKSTLSQQKKPEMDKITIKVVELRRYFPESYTPRRMHDIIIKLLDMWSKRQQTAPSADDAAKTQAEQKPKPTRKRNRDDIAR